MSVEKLPVLTAPFEVSSILSSCRVLNDEDSPCVSITLAVSCVESSCSSSTKPRASGNPASSL